MATSKQVLLEVVGPVLMKTSEGLMLFQGSCVRYGSHGWLARFLLQVLAGIEAALMRFLFMSTRAFPFDHGGKDRPWKLPYKVHEVLTSLPTHKRYNFSI